MRTLAVLLQDRSIARQALEEGQLRKNDELCMQVDGFFFSLLSLFLLHFFTGVRNSLPIMHIFVLAAGAGV